MKETSRSKNIFARSWRQNYNQAGCDLDVNYDITSSAIINNAEDASFTITNNLEAASCGIFSPSKISVTETDSFRTQCRSSEISKSYPVELACIQGLLILIRGCSSQNYHHQENIMERISPIQGVNEGKNIKAEGDLMDGLVTSMKSCSLEATPTYRTQLDTVSLSTPLRMSIQTPNLRLNVTHELHLLIQEHDLHEAGSEADFQRLKKKTSHFHDAWKSPTYESPQFGKPGQDSRLR